MTLMGKPNISYHSVRLNLDNEQHRRVHKVLAELNTEIHKSVNQFLIDAADFYIRSFEDENLLKEAESRRDKGAEYISRSDLDGIREELKSEVKNEIILLLGAALSKGVAAGAGMAEQTVGMAAGVEERQKEPESDATMEGLVDDWG